MTDKELEEYNKFMLDNREAMGELYGIAKSGKDKSVAWNKFNDVIQSGLDGEVYISIADALKFAKVYHNKYVRKKKLDKLLEDES